MMLVMEFLYEGVFFCFGEFLVFIELGIFRELGRWEFESFLCKYVWGIYFCV